MYIIDNHRQVWTNAFIKSTLISLVCLGLSIGVNYFASTYASERASLSITDLILSNTRVFDVDGIILAFSLLLFMVTTYWALAHEPQSIPYLLKSIALFVFIRSIFMTLTHLGPFSPHVSFDSTSRLVTILGFGYASDLFFSGHTGLPFLLSMIYWPSRFIRYVLLGISVGLAGLVLLGHLHYSIDVFAAYFITYTIFHISQYLFRTDLTFRKQI